MDLPKQQCNQITLSSQMKVKGSEELDERYSHRPNTRPANNGAERSDGEGGEEG